MDNNNKEISVISEEYINWFIDYMDRKKGYYDFANSFQLSPNSDTKYINIIHRLHSVIEEYAVEHEIEPTPSLFFAKPYRVSYTKYDDKGEAQEFRFLISFGFNGVSVCSNPREDHELNNGEFIDLNEVFKEELKKQNGTSKTKNTNI